jgi:hypothetical protein
MSHSQPNSHLAARRATVPIKQLALVSVFAVTFVCHLLPAFAERSRLLEGDTSEHFDRVGPATKEVRARVSAFRVLRDHVLVTISAGSDRGVDKSWRVQLLRGATGAPLAGGKLVIVRVGRDRTLAKTQLTADEIAPNPEVLLAPPAR